MADQRLERANRLQPELRGVAKTRFENDLDRLVSRKRCEPSLAGGRDVQSHSCRHLRLIDEPGAGALRLRHPSQPVTGDDGQACEFAALPGDAVEHRLTNIWNADTDKESLPQDREAQT